MSTFLCSLKSEFKIGADNFQAAALCGLDKIASITPKTPSNALNDSTSHSSSPCVPSLAKSSNDNDSDGDNDTDLVICTVSFGSGTLLR